MFNFRRLRGIKSHPEGGPCTIIYDTPVLKPSLPISLLVATKSSPSLSLAPRSCRLESYLQRLCSLLYMAPLHPSSAYVAHLLQDFLGTSPRVETLERLQRSRPERELRQALQVWNSSRFYRTQCVAAVV